MIAIIGAQDEEIRAIKSLFSSYQMEDLNGYSIYVGRLNNQSVLLAKSAIGGVACSVLMTLLFTRYPIDFVYNVGTAGSFSKAQTAPFDVVIAEKLAYYDADVTFFSPYRYGQMAGCPAFYKSDKVTIDKIRGMSWPFTLRYGTILSGDKFVEVKHDVLSIIDQYFTNDNILAFDMESTYFAQTCYIFHKPFLVIRIISDIIDQNKQKESYDKVLELSSHYYSLMLAKLIQ